MATETISEAAKDPPSDDDLISVRRGDLSQIMAAAFLVNDLFYASFDESDAAPVLAAFSKTEEFLDLLAERGLASTEDASPEETLATGVETVVALSSEFQQILMALYAQAFPEPLVADGAILAAEAPA